MCPTYEAYPFEHYAAGGRIAISRAWLEGFIEKPEEIVESVFSCLGCGACQEICQAYTDMPFPVPDGIDTPRVMRALRGELQVRGLAPQGIKDLDESVEKRKNAFAGDMKEKRRLAERFNLPSRGDTLFFAGCYPFFKDRMKRVEKTLTVLKNTKSEVAFLAEEEWCCGILQHADGNELLAREMALHNVKTISERGAKQVITSCSGCFNALSSLYPTLLKKELNFDVVHTSQYFLKLLDEKDISFSRELKVKVTYHDPCHLGRMCKIFEEPRKVLAQIPGVTLTEMERAREKAWCCGGGEGIVSLAYPHLAADIGKGRVLEANKTGASALVTTCPHCISQLTIAIKRLKLPITCMDLSEVVLDAMGV